MPIQTTVCGRPLEGVLETIERFHGWKAPGVVIGAFMVDLAQESMGPAVEADAIVETRHCLPDAIQLFTPCTFGNGSMKVLNWDKFALTLYDKKALEGFRVWLDLAKTRKFPNLYNWYMRLVPKQSLPLDVLLESILAAGTSMLSFAPVTVTRYFGKEKKVEIGVCNGCGEAYPCSRGTLCLACQGECYSSFRGERAPESLRCTRAGPDRSSPVCEVPYVSQMKIRVQDAVGMVLAHDVTEIRRGEFKGPAFRKGYRIRDVDVCHLHRLGKRHLYVLKIEEGFMHEDDAAENLAQAFCGPGVTWKDPPKEGKIALVAERDGLFKVNVEALERINLLGDIMCASRHTNSLVRTGDTVAATRAIPLVVPKPLVDEATSIAMAGEERLLEVKPLRKARAGIVITGNEVFTHLIEDQFEMVLRRKLQCLGSEVIGAILAPDDTEFIVDQIKRFLSEGADLLLVTGGMSVDPDDVTRQAVMKAGGSDFVYGSPVLPGAMFMISSIGSVPVLGVPACGLYHEMTILDLVLPRILAGAMLTRRDIATMGHGGLSPLPGVPLSHLPLRKMRTPPRWTARTRETNPARDKEAEDTHFGFPANRGGRRGNPPVSRAASDGIGSIPADDGRKCV